MRCECGIPGALIAEAGPMDAASAILGPSGKNSVPATTGKTSRVSGSLGMEGRRARDQRFVFVAMAAPALLRALAPTCLRSDSRLRLHEGNGLTTSCLLVAFLRMAAHPPSRAAGRRYA